MYAINLRQCLLVFVVAQLVYVDSLLADALVMTRAMKSSTIVEVFVDDEQIRVEIEIGAQDIASFRNILPDDLFEKLTGESIPLKDRLQMFLKDDWVMRAEDQQLLGKLVRVDVGRRLNRDDVTGEKLPNQPEDAEIVIRLALQYELERLPATLTIRPPLTGDDRVEANIGYVVYHKGVAVNDFRYLSSEETLRLDWGDPWYSAFERRTLRRRYFAPAAAFLYVDNFEVRKEIVFRPKDLQHWLDLGLGDSTEIQPGDRERIYKRVAEFLNEHTPMEIDGKRASGSLDRIHFIKRTLRSTGVLEPDEVIDLDSALIGAIYVIRVEGLPKHVTMGWDLFNDRITKIPAVASDEVGGLPSTLDPDDSILEWRNYLKNPTIPSFLSVQLPPQPAKAPIPISLLVCLVALAAVWVPYFRSPREASRWRRLVLVSVVMIIVATLVMPWTTLSVVAPGSQRSIAAEDAADVTHSLLHNVYRAFDYRDESMIYDVLDRSVAGELLRKVYLDTSRSLTIAAQGGARVKVTQVELVDCQPKPNDQGGFSAACVWCVTGSVSHWGHLHQRKNQYHAEVVISPVEGQWKMQDVQILKEERVN